METRRELRQKVDAGYYGYNLDEEDGSLLAYEAEKIREAHELMLMQDEDKEDRDWEALPGHSGDGAGWKLTTVEEVEVEMIERRKRKLLDGL